jgi:hypothetical protein
MITPPDNDPAEHCRGLVGESLRQAQVAERDRRVHVVGKKRPQTARVGTNAPRDADLKRPDEALHGPIVGIQGRQLPGLLQSLHRITAPESALHRDTQSGLVVWLTPEEALDLCASRLNVPDLEERLGQYQPGGHIPRVTR